MEQVYPKFDAALELGRHNENVLAHEFAYRGIPVARTRGEHPFDLYLPDGRSVEVKIDLRSQCTGRGAIEARTLQRRPDFLVQTFTEARVYPFLLLREVYGSGKAPRGGFGNLKYDGRHCAGMRERGIPLDDFIDFLRE